MNLSNTQLFRGLEEAEITSLLGCQIGRAHV